MNFLHFSLLSIGCLFFLARAAADTIWLNNGESIQGKVISEDDTHYLVEVQITKTIKDEKKFLKSEIKSVRKEALDAAPYLKLKEIVPTPDLLTPNHYKERINLVEDFIKNFPRSEKLGEAKQILETLTAEFEVINSGGMKLSGEMVSVDTYLGNAYMNDQLIALQRINQEISYGNFLGALRLFTDYESKFANGATRKQLVPRMKQLLGIFKNTVTESLANYDFQMQTREQGLSRMSPDDRARTEQALKEQESEVKARFDREKVTKGMWITPDANYKETLVESVRQIDAEIKRLETLPKNNGENIVLEKSYSEAWQQLPTASPEEQKVIMEKLKRELMPVYYLDLLNGRTKPQE